MQRINSKSDSWSLKTNLSSMKTEESSEEKKKKQCDIKWVICKFKNQNLLTNSRSECSIPRIKLYSDFYVGNSFSCSTLYMPHLPPKYNYKYNSPSCHRPKTVSVQVAIQENISTVLVAIGKRCNKFMLHVFLNDRGIWSLGQEIPIPALTKRSIVRCGQCLYFIGGEYDDLFELNRQPKSRDLFKYNIRTEELVPGPDLPFGRCSSAVCMWDNTIYVIGGISTYDCPLTSVIAYNVLCKSWRTIQPLKYPRLNSGIIVINGIIYVIGGHTVHCEYLSIEIDSAWAELPNLPKFYRDLPMIATYYEDKVIAFRKFRPDRAVVLDKQRDEWIVVRIQGKPPIDIEDSVTYGRSCFAVMSGGQIFELDLKKFKWHEVVSCPNTLSKIYHIICINLHKIK